VAYNVLMGGVVLRIAVLAALVIVVASAIALVMYRSDGTNHRDVLNAGYHVGMNRMAHHVGDTEARRTAARVYATWRAGLRERGRAAPRQRFDNPSPSEYRATLRALARRHDFTVVSTTLLKPRQLAPVVVVRTSDYERLARTTIPKIWRQLNPKRDTGDDRTGWRWEGFFFEAVDERGVPFLAAFDSMRGRHRNGGQWARSDALFPFPHG
jgi:hypothetical protein